ncbi:MAG: homocysteine S-methyltransferase family protein, partial [Myxococcota bacterium]
MSHGWKQEGQDRGLIMDGAMGTLLEDQGCDVSTPLWGSGPLLEAHGMERVMQLHRKYVAAGADVILANTHNAGEAYVRRWWEDARRRDRVPEMDSPEALLQAVNQAAVEAARAARPRFAGACLASPDVPYTTRATLTAREVAEGLRLQLAALIPLALDLIVFEMCTTAHDLEGVALAWRDSRPAGSPGKGPGLGVGLVFAEDGCLLDGTSPQAALARLEPAEPDAIFVQCTPYPFVSRALNGLRRDGEQGWLLGAYANDGRGYEDGSWTGSRVDPNAYAVAAEGW